MQMASEPIDTLWKNMGGIRGMYIFRRIFLNLLALIVILFITTPTVMLSALKMVDIFNFFDMASNMTEYIPLGNFIKAHFPPLMILGINLILLVLIDFTTLI